MTTFYFQNKYVNDDKTEIDFLMSSEDEANPIVFVEKVNRKKVVFLRIPEYLGKQTSRHRFIFWQCRDNPDLKVYPSQKYSVRAFRKNQEYVFFPVMKDIKKSVQSILRIKDDYRHDIRYDTSGVFLKNYNTIKVNKDIVRNGNMLHMLVKVNPQLIEITDEVKSAINENKKRIPGYVEGDKQDKVVNVWNETKQLETKIVKDDDTINVNQLDTSRTNKEILDEFLDQEIDCPIQLVELLKLGISCQARTANTLQQDPRVGTTYIINPFLERYELAVKKALENQFLNQPSMDIRPVQVKGFF
jgi:hypothetical protein